MSLLSSFGFGNIGGYVDPALTDIFPFPYLQDSFVQADLETVFSRILTDTFERTQGLKEDQVQLLSDNCLFDEGSEGLITMLAKAMVAKGRLFLIYDPALKIIRKAKAEEITKIEAEYKSGKQGQTGIYINFGKYAKIDMLKIYSIMEFCTVASLHKQANLSKAIQLKFKDFRSSVSSVDVNAIKGQASAMAKALQEGKDIAMDGEDSIETATPDLTATKATMDFTAQKKGLYLGMPATYISGEASAGLGDSGKGDTKSIERGLKNYFYSVVRPVCKALFGVTVSFKSDDFDMLSTGLECLKTFEITGDEYMSAENKRIVVNKAFGFDQNTKGGEPKEVPPPPEPIEA